MSLWVKFYSVTIQMKATEQYFPVVMFIMLYKVILSFESADKVVPQKFSLSGCSIFFLSLSSCATLLLTHIQYHVLFVVYLCNQSSICLAAQTSVCHSI